VIFRRQPFGIIKTAGRDVNLVQGVIVLESQLGAAPRTETPHSLWG